jgi:hypothetical protein
MYELHTYHTASGYRWSVVAENGNKLASGDQGYSRTEDMSEVLGKLFIVEGGETHGLHVPWEDCALHNSRHGKCYKHKLIDARKLGQFLPGDESEPSPHDQ